MANELTHDEALVLDAIKRSGHGLDTINDIAKQIDVSVYKVKKSLTSTKERGLWEWESSYFFHLKNHRAITPSGTEALARAKEKQTCADKNTSTLNIQTA